MNARILYVDTIDRFATALIRHPGQKLCAEFRIIRGDDYDHMEKYYGLANYCCTDYSWVNDLKGDA